MNTCHHVPDDSDINDALSKTFSQGNPTLKLYCVYTDSCRNFRNLSLSRRYECGGRYMTCSEKTPTVQFILNQLNAGHALNMTVEWVAFLIRIREVTVSDFGLVTGHAQVYYSHPTAPQVNSGTALLIRPRLLSSTCCAFH
jgi:hypothetical protein